MTGKSKMPAFLESTAFSWTIHGVCSKTLLGHTTENQLGKPSQLAQAEA
jgi:hypothetical protein